jgi:predicted RND superfamily exporter protein
VEDSIRETLLESGRANIYAALALICGCSVFLVSTFKPIVLFGILMVIVIAANNIGALLILPSVIKVIRFDIIAGPPNGKASI